MIWFAFDLIEALKLKSKMIYLLIEYRKDAVNGIDEVTHNAFSQEYVQLSSPFITAFAIEGCPSLQC